MVTKEKHIGLFVTTIAPAKSTSVNGFSDEFHNKFISDTEHRQRLVVSEFKYLDSNISFEDIDGSDVFVLIEPPVYVSTRYLFGIRQDEMEIKSTIPEYINNKLIRYYTLFSKFKSLNKKAIVVGLSCIPVLSLFNFKSYTPISKYPKIDLTFPVVRNQKIRFNDSNEEHVLAGRLETFHFAPTINHTLVKKIAYGAVDHTQLKFDSNNNDSGYKLKSLNDSIEFDNNKLLDLMIFEYNNILFIKYEELLQSISRTDSLGLKVKSIISNYLLS